MYVALGRARAEHRPKDPTTLDFIVEEDQLPEGFLRADLTVGRNRHLIFTTDHQLRLLAKAKKWYAEGTFNVVRRPFYQLFGIHVSLKSGRVTKQVRALRFRPDVGKVGTGLCGGRKRVDLTLADKVKVIQLLDRVKKLSQKEHPEQEEEARGQERRRVEDALMHWFGNARAKGAHIPGPILMEKARQFAVGTGEEDFKPPEG
ncbi:Hypp8290 [Branchiostoma lanceolatum]|uniref:Hypp8290 protein n=1 Tax=Branchiostoma lanceolatum TaxID=7740 RepID=A0A8K0EF62_BRALA|nr:Hypp8290 [Branchiostoma lanceolatum]